jgi:Superinfection immunity protein
MRDPGETRENGFMPVLANSYAFWIFVFVALAVVYMLPTLIGMIRGVDRLALVFLVNLIGAPTGVGWFAAMILAFGPRRCHPGSWPCGLPRDRRRFGRLAGKTSASTVAVAGMDGQDNRRAGHDELPRRMALVTCIHQAKAIIT